MNGQVTPTPLQVDRAFAQVKRPDWPWTSVDQLRAEKARIDLAFGLVQGCANAMARGQPLPEVAPPLPPAAAPVPRAALLRRKGEPQHGQDLPFDPRLAASGEYLKQGDPS